MTLVSQAKYAQMKGVSRPAITQWKKRGWLVLQGSQVDVEATDAYLERYRPSGVPSAKEGAQSVKQGQSLNKHKQVRLTQREIVKRLEALDHTQDFEWSDKARLERARMAAGCIGWEAVESDGRLGYFQLRIKNGGELDGLPVGGFDFELSPSDVLRECRDDLEPLDDDAADDVLMVRLDLLHLLAYPFWGGAKSRNRKSGPPAPGGQ